MRQDINHSLINKIPVNHFGALTNKVTESLINGSCCGVYGLPGYGMEFFAKQVINIIQNAYPDVGTLLINVDLNQNDIKIFKEKKVENYIKENKLIIVLAEVLSPSYTKFYKYLNSLRWLYPDNLSVLTVANYTLYSEYDSYINCAPDLFQQIYQINPFSLKSTAKIIELNNNEYHWDTPMKCIDRIYSLSGGIPAITKYICMAMYEEGNELIDLPEKLIKIQPLKKRIQDLSQLITDLKIEDQKHFGLINSKGEVFPDILKVYLKTNSYNELPISLRGLTKNEKHVLEYLIANPRRIIDKDQISLILGQNLDTYSEWAIYKIMERLTKKTKNVFDIASVYGQGWVIKDK